MTTTKATTKLEQTKIEQFRNLNAQYDGETKRFKNELAEAERKISILKGEMTIRIGEMKPTEDVEEEIRKQEATAESLRNRIAIMPTVKAEKMTSMLKEVEAEVYANHAAIKPEYDAQREKINAKRAELLLEIAKLYGIDARAKAIFYDLKESQRTAGVQETYRGGSLFERVPTKDDWTYSGKEHSSKQTVTVPAWLVEDALKGELPKWVKEYNDGK